MLISTKWDYICLHFNENFSIPLYLKSSEMSIYLRTFPLVHVSYNVLLETSKWSNFQELVKKSIWIAKKFSEGFIQRQAYV